MKHLMNMTGQHEKNVFNQILCKFVTQPKGSWTRAQHRVKTIISHMTPVPVGCVLEADFI